MKIELEQCSKCHRMMEADDLAYNEDEDFHDESFSLEMLDAIASNKYSILCFDCLRKIKLACKGM